MPTNTPCHELARFRSWRRSKFYTSSPYPGTILSSLKTNAATPTGPEEISDTVHWNWQFVGTQSTERYVLEISHLFTTARLNSHQLHNVLCNREILLTIPVQPKATHSQDHRLFQFLPLSMLLQVRRFQVLMTLLLLLASRQHTLLWQANTKTDDTVC